MSKQIIQTIETEPALVAELAQRQTSLEQALDKLATREATLRGEVESLETQARQLEMRRVETVAKADRVAGELDVTRAWALAECTRLVMSRLRRQNIAIANAAEASESPDAIAERRQLILDDNPEMAAKYNAYQAGANFLESHDSVPAYILEAHRKAAEQVAPLLELDAQLANPRQSASILALDLLYHAQGRLLQVVLPVDSEGLEYNDELSTISTHMVEALVSALMEMLQVLEVAPVDFHETTWAGFQALQIEFDAEFEPTSLCRHYTGYLVQSFEALSDVPFSARLATTLIDDSLWLHGQDAEAVYAPAPQLLSSTIALFAPSLAAQEHPSPVGVDETGDLLDESPVEATSVDSTPATAPATETQNPATGDPVPEESVEVEVEEPIGQLNRYFTKKDIVGWNRPLRSVADSKWNQRARRIRTMMMRMAGNGNIGAAQGVQQDSLLENLPDRDRNDLSQAIELMLAVGFLSSSEDDTDTAFTISPSRLEEIAGLINRDVSEGWIAVLQ